ncbi:MAG: DEAD/DEAH box helicase [Oscillospiraceae bacterium]
MPSSTLKRFAKLPKNSGIKCALLTGSLTKKQKDEVKAGLKSGEIKVAVGTHALLTDDVEFENLGLVVTDEQHRFGVGQRGRLSSKGNNPHTLVMSATPIPRTLGLIIYGDLDISIIDEYPAAGRKSRPTALIPHNARYITIVKIHRRGAAGVHSLPSRR